MDLQSAGDLRERSERRRAPPPDPPAARSEGVAGVTLRMRERAAAKILPPGSARLPVTRADMERVAAVAAAGWTLPEPLPAAPGEPLTIAWVTVPPSAGSGGATTMFRMISALEHAGHTCIVYLDDRTPGRSTSTSPRSARAGRACGAEIRDLAAGIEDAHAIFATSWQTAYPVLGSPGARDALLLRAGPRAVVLSRPAATRCSPRRPTASASTASPPAAGSRSCCRASTAWPPTTSTSAATSSATASTRRPVPPSAGRRSATTAAPRPRGARSSWRSWRSTCSPSATRRSTSTCSDGPSSGLPFPATVTASSRPSSSTTSTTAASPASRCPPRTSRSCRTRCSPRAACRSSTRPSTTGSCSTTPRSCTRTRRRSSSPTRSRRWSSAHRRSARAAAAAAAASVSSRSWDDAGRQVDRIVRAVVTDAARPLAA